MDVPHLFGRGPATDSLRAVLGDARDWASSAASELEQAGPAVDDARSAVEQLVTDIDDMRFERGVAKARRGDAFRATVDGARTWTTGLQKLEQGSVAIDQGHAVDWFRSALDPSADRGTLQAAGVLASDARLDSLGGAGRVLRRFEVADARSHELARIALEGDVPRASSLLLDDLLDASRSGAGVSTGDLRLALEGLDDGVGDGARRLPTWLGDDVSTIALDDIHRADLGLRRDLPDPADLANEVRTTILRPLDQLTREQVARVAAAAGDPELVAALRAGEDGHAQLLQMWRGTLTDARSAQVAAADLLATARPTTDTARRLAMVADVDPAAAFGEVGDDAWRASMREQLAASSDDRVGAMLVDSLRTARSTPSATDLAAGVQTLLADEVLEPASLSRLASLASLPESIRPTALADLRESLTEAVRTGASGSLHDLRWNLERASILADPDPSSRVLAAVGSIVDKPNADMTVDDLRRLERLTSLPPETVSGLPPRAGSYSWSQIADAAWLPDRDSDSLAEFGNLRVWAGARRVDSDAAVTRGTLRDQYHAILAKDSASVDHADMLRLAIMDEVDQAKGPDIPAAIGEARASLVRRGAVPRADDAARREFDSLREWGVVQRMEADPGVTRESLLAQLDDVLGKRDGDVTKDDLRFLARLDRLSGDKRIELPGQASSSYSRQTIADSAWLPKNDSDSRAEFASLRTWREREKFAAEPHTRESLLAELDELADAPDDAITDSRLLRLANIAEAAKGHGIDGVPTNVPHLREWRLVQRMEADPRVTRETLLAQLDDVLGKRDGDVTKDDLKFVARLDRLTGDKRIELPSQASSSYSRQTIADSAWLPRNDSDSKAEFASLRTWREREKFAAEPHTRESLLAELDELVDIADDEISETRQLRLANIAEAAEGHGIHGVPTNVPHLREWRLVQRMEADPSVTRESLLARLDDVLAKGDGDVTKDDLQFLARMDRLSGDKRIELPEQASSSYSRQTIADSGWLPRNDSDSKAEFASLRSWREREKFAAEPHTRESLLAELDELLAAPDNAITESKRLRLGFISQEAERQGIQGVPTNVEHLREWRLVQGMEGDPSVTRATLLAQLDEVLAKRDKDVTKDDLRFVARLDRITSDKRIELPHQASSSYSRQTIADSAWLPHNDSDSKAEFASLRSWREREKFAAEPHTRESLLAELDELVDASDKEITHSQVLRLANIAAAAEGHGIHGVPTNVAHLREWRLVQHMEADPSITRESLLAQLDEVLDKGDGDITKDDLTFLARLDRLGGDKRVELPAQASTSYSRQTIADSGWLPKNDSDSRAEFASLRAWRERRKLLDDPTLTRDAVVTRFTQAVLKPDDLITPSELNLLALLDELPDHLRIDVPAPVRGGSRSGLGLVGSVSSGSSASSEIASLRAWAMTSTDAGRDVARQKVLAGEPLEGALLRSLAGGDDAVLASIGVTRTDLLDSAVANLDGTGSTNLTDVLANLKLAQSLVTGVEGTGHIQTAREDAIRLLQRNVDRIEGRLHDGYSNYPDYAEIGAAVTQAKTAVGMQRRLAEVAARAGAQVGQPANAEKVGETLTW
ncbi:MAG: hypothetical protein JWL76_1120 [Thermoleophilia bacterium]|nr:hypothetical protein [Thermoleophilia bacterium]